MRSVSRLTVITLGLALIAPAGAMAATEIWRLGGFDLPESVSWDPAANVFYVSNLGTDPMSKDGNGFISKVKADGTIDTLKWVTGLDAPKGTEVVGGKLYVSDIDRLVEIDTANGKIANSYPAEGAKFLNDLAVTADGRVYIADSFTNTIYLFENGAVSAWLTDPKLNGPNGLTIIGSDLVVASLGDLSGGFENLKPANVRKVDLASKAITDFGSPEMFGNLDGIEPNGKGGVTVTDNGGGRLLEVMPGAAATEIVKLAPGSADHEYVGAQKLYVVPQMRSGEIVGYKAE
jgi:sugar lactone lactonase YvrE